MLDQIIVILGITMLIMISPGPDMVIVMRNTIIGGRAAGLKSSLGVLTGNMVHITYCAIGVGIVISQSILAFSILKYAGAAYLIYLGITSFFAKETKLSTGDLKPRSNNQRWFWQGFLNNILNPKGTLFYLGVFSMVITPDTATGTTVLLVAIMMTVSAVFWLFFVYTLDTSLVRRVLERGQTLVNRVFGGLLVFLGIRVAFMER